MSQQEILFFLQKEAKKTSLRFLAKKLGVRNHTTLNYWLKGGGMSVKNLEHLQKELEKWQISK